MPPSAEKSLLILFSSSLQCEQFFYAERDPRIELIPKYATWKHKDDEMSTVYSYTHITLGFPLTSLQAWPDLSTREVIWLNTNLFKITH